MKLLSKSLSILLVGLLLTAAAGRAAAAPRLGQSEGRTEKVRANMKKLGVGESSRVEVRLLDGTRLKGYVREADQNGFVVVDRTTGAARSVNYDQVDRLKGRGMSTGTKVAIGFGLAAAVLGTLAVIGLALSD